jgi:hypothetical protein
MSGHIETRIVFATKANTCEICTAAIEPGAMIIYYRATKTVAHAACDLRARRRART